MMIAIDLIYNLSLLVALSILSGFIDSRWKRNTLYGSILQGTLFGSAAVIGMLRPLVISPGLIFDGRSVMISLCALYYGPVPVIIACLMTVTCRIVQGGVGSIMGVSVIIASALIGYLFYLRRKNNEYGIHSSTLLIFGFIVHIVMLALAFTLPFYTAIDTLNKIGIPVILTYPLATVLIGKILSDQEMQTNFVKSLEESEERWKFALEGAGDGVWDWNIQENKVYYSHQWKAMLGYTDEEIGNTIEEWDKLVHPGDKQGCYDDLEKHFKRETPFYQNEHRLLCKAGTYKWILDRGKVIQWDNDGKPIRIIGTHTDISERKNAEEALKEAEERYRNIFENAAIGIFQTTPGGKFLSANPAYVKILGYDSPEDLINSITDIGQQVYVDPNQRQKLIELLDISGEVKAFPVKLFNKNKNIIWGLVDARVFKDSDNKVIYYQGSIIDITEKTKLEETQKQLESQLRQAQKMEAIGTLAGGIAHDFNNILMAILGYTEMSLMETSIESITKQYLEQVRKASYRAKDLVDQILIFSRKQEGERKPIEINIIMKEAIKLLRASLPTTIEIRQTINTNGHILGDPTQIHQIIMNLCTNAFHAMPNGGILEVSLDDVEISSNLFIDLPTGQYVKLQIKDTGVGIDPNIKERIFEPYFTTKDVGKGSGLGLAVVMGIVKSHGGAISVESKSGEGTTFTIFLPQTRKENITIENKFTHNIVKATGRILLVDDEVAIVDIAKAALEMMGYEVVSSTDSMSALELFRMQPDKFDLIITDLTMPKITGIDLAHRVSEIMPNIPIILCTGYRDIFTQEDIKKVGVSDIITKPIGIKELCDAVQKVLRENQEN